MAKVKSSNPLAELVSGKQNKRDDKVYRVRNFKQQRYVPLPNTVPASNAQKSHRKEFGKINSIVNVLIANPDEHKAAEQRMNKLNRKLPASKRFKTVHQFLYHEVKAQLAQQSAAKARKQEKEVLLPRGVKLHINHFTDLTAAELYEILKARYAVFTLEQHIIYLDMDNIDYTATHICLRRKAQVIAYARLFHDAGDPPTTLRIGRMLTTDRGKGFGRFLMQQLIAQAQSQGATTLQLHAQLPAVPFYEHFGFQTVGEPFLEADLQHILMQRNI